MNLIRKNKIWLILVIPCLLLILVFFSALFRPRLLAPAESDPVPQALPEETPAPQKKPTSYSATYFLRGKNRGICKSLTGRVLLNFYLVSDGDCIWTEEAVAEFKRTTEDAVYYLKYDASRYNVPLDVTLNFVPCTMEELMARDAHEDAIPALLNSLGYESKYDAPAALAEEFGVDSVGLLFCFNRAERSHAYLVLSENGFEYAILYGSTEDFRHELFHLYGACDLYTPEDVHTVAKKYLTDSIMIRSSSPIIDSLNAYNVGWTDELDEHAKGFLEAIQ